jgi:hypothetical protein
MWDFTKVPKDIVQGLKYQGKTPLDRQYTLKKMKDREAKQASSGGSWEGGEHKKRVNKGEYGGCFLNSYLKTRNQLKFF